MVSTPVKGQTVGFISEAGPVVKEYLPMFTGYVTAELLKMTWVVIHRLKITAIDKDGNKEQILLISERNYKPLNPFGRVIPEDTTKDKDGQEETIALQTVADTNYANELALLGKKDNENAKTAMYGKIVMWCFIVIIVKLAFKFFGKVWGGG